MISDGESTFKKISTINRRMFIFSAAKAVIFFGIEGRLFLVYQNYKNLLYYNCSSYYAASIGLLSDEINF